MEVVEMSHCEHEHNTAIEQVELQNTKSITSENIQKRKNIVERFVKTKGGEKKKSTRLLKTNAPNTFKTQRTKKLSSQWDKAKPMLLTTDLNKLPFP